MPERKPVKKVSENLKLKNETEASLTTIRLVLGIFIIFFLSSAIIRFIFGVPFPLFVFVLILIWMVLYLLYYSYVQNKKTGENLYGFYFLRSVIDLFLITVIIHFLGGVEWIGAILYISVLSWASATLPKKQVIMLSLVAVAFYFGLALLQLFELLAYRTAFGPSRGLYQDPVYIATQILILTIIFLFISENYGTLANNFRENQKKLLDSQEKLEEAKNILEIKVGARTKELQELAKGLEKEVDRRTKDAQEKVKELERFKQLAVGRELKMIELKKEIKKLKERFKLKSD